MNTVDIYNRLRKKVDELKIEIAKDEGRAQEITERMKKEFGCASIDDAKDLLSKKKAESEAIKDDLATKMEAFSDKWDERLS
jgi:phage terminase small subunit